MSDGTAKPRRLRGCLTKLVLVGGIGVGALALATFSGWAWLRSDPGERWLKGQIETLAQKSMQEGTFEIGKIETDLWGNIGIDDLVIKDGQGNPVIDVKAVDAELSLIPLLTQQRLVIPRVTLYRPLIDLRTREDGLNIAQLFGPGNPDAPRSDNLLPIGLEIQQAQIRQATVTLDGAGIQSLSVDTRIDYTDDVLSVIGLDARGDWIGEVASGPLKAHGGIEYDWDPDTLRIPQLKVATLGQALTAKGQILELAERTGLDIDVLVERLDMARLDPLLLNNAGLTGVWEGDAHVGGVPTLLDITAVVDDPQGVHGGLDAGVTVNLQDALAWDVKGQLRDFELNGLLTPVTDVIRINGEVTVSGRGDTWPDDMVIEGSVDGGKQLVYGFEIDELVGDFRVAKGTVNLLDVNAIVPYADLIANGTIDVIDGPLDIRVGGSIHPAGLASMNLPGLSGAGRANVRVTGNVFADQVDYDLRGRAAIDRFGYQGLVDIGTLTSGIRGHVGADVLDLDLDLTAEAIAASGVEIDVIHAPSVDVRYAFNGYIDASSDALDIGTVRYPDVFMIEDGTGDFTFEMDPRGEYLAQVDVILGPLDLMGYSGTGGLAAVTVDPRTASFDVWFQDGFRTLARTIGTYDLAEARVELVGLTAAPIPGGDWNANGPISFTVVEGGVADASVDILSPHGRIRARGDLGTVGDLDGVVSVNNLDLNYVSRLVPDLEQDLAGQMDMGLTVVGPASSVSLDGFVRGDVSVDGRLPLAMDVNFFADDNIANVDGIFLAGEQPLGTLEGTIPVILDLAAPDLDRTGDLDINAFIAPGDLDRFAQVSGAAVPAGAISGVLTASGPVLDPKLYVRAVIETDVPELANDGRIEVAIDRNVGHIEGWATILEGYSPIASIDGTAETSLSHVFAWALGETDEEPDWTDYNSFASAIDANLKTQDLPMSLVADALNVDVTMGGYVRGGAHIEGGANKPVVTADIEWIDARIGDTAFDAVTLDLHEDGAGYRLDTLIDFTDAGQLTINGDIPVDVDLRTGSEDWATGDLDIQIESDDLPVTLAAAFIPGASRADGKLTLNGTIAGTVFDPQPDVRLTLRDGQMAYAPLGVQYQGATADVHFRYDLVELSDFSVVTKARRGIIAFADEFSNSLITANATATLEGWFPSEVSGTVSMKNAWLVALSEMQIQTTGELDVSGTYPDLVVTGEFNVDDVLIVQDLASFLTVAPLQLDERITVIRGDQAAQEQLAEAPVEPPPPGLTETIQVDIDVSLDRSVQVQVAFPFLEDLGSVGASVTRADVFARLGGDIDFSMRGGEMKLFGVVDVLDGTMRVLQTTFDLRGGSTTFQGDPFNPILDLSAVSEIGSAEIQLTVSGTATEPEIDFRSEEYPDQSQIFTMLITGSEPDTLNSEQGSAATEALVGLLLSSVLSGARLGSISYDPDGTVRVGIPVASDVYLNTAVATQPDIGDNVFAGSIEWAIARQIVLEVTIGNRFSNGDLFWETRF